MHHSVGGRELWHIFPSASCQPWHVVCHVTDLSSPTHLHAPQGIWLDNFVVGDDIAAALKLAETTWRPKFDAWEAVAAAEKRQKELEQAKQKRCGAVVRRGWLVARVVLGWLGL